MFFSHFFRRNLTFFQKSGILICGFIQCGVTFMVLNNKFFRLWITVGAFLLFLGTACCFWICTGSPQVSQQEFDRNLCELHKSHRRKINILYDQFCSDLNGMPDKYFQSAVRNVNGVAEQFASFKNVSTMIYLMAADKISSQNRSGEFISTILKDPILDHCVAGSYACQESLQNFLHKLQEQELLFRLQLVQEMKRLPIHPGSISTVQTLADSLGSLSRQINDLALAKTSATVGTAVELIFIKSLMRAMNRLFAKVMAKAAVSSSLPAADGPLPVGDLLALGGFVWCAYDIYTVQAVLPAELRSNLIAAVETCRDTSRSRALACAKEALELCRTSADKTLLQLRSR